MINVLLNGCNGNMGKEIKKYIDNIENFSIICGFDRIDSGDNDFPVYTNTDSIIETPDIIIDFSIPTASINILNYAVLKKIPIVIATTGFLNEQLNYIEEASKLIPIFKSSNMSLEINIMNILVSKLSKLLADCDIEIIEIHHKNKIDSPSGTALMLADSINSSLNNSMTYTYDRTTSREKRKQNEIGIHSVRGGTEVGKHTVLFLGDNESFEITHTVSSRKIFAVGAIKASEFIVNKQNGLYGMEDLVHFN